MKEVYVTRLISNRQASIFAWAVAIASMSALLAGVFAIYLSRDMFTSWYVEAVYPAGLAVALGFTPVGALIASRQPHNAFGWLMLTIGMLYCLSPAGLGYALASFHLLPAPLPGAALVAWIGNWAWSLGAVLLPLMILYFPNGRLPAPIWRWVWLPVIVSAFDVVVRAIYGVELWQTLGPGVVEASARDTLDQIPGTLGLIQRISSVAAVVAILASVASLVYRYRRADVAERSQIKWIVFASAIALGVTAILILASASYRLGVGSWVTNLLLLLQIASIFLSVAAFGIAILRHRLFDIDIIVRRTTSYAILTGLLVLVYFGSIVVLQRLFSSVTGQTSTVAVVLSTLLIAALFLPLRRRVQDAIDRRFFRRKYDAEKVLSTFAATVRDETDLEALTAELVRVIEETMQPEFVHVWLAPAASIPVDGPAENGARDL
jgi:hypothetical protein